MRSLWKLLFPQRDICGHVVWNLPAIVTLFVEFFKVSILEDLSLFLTCRTDTWVC